MHVRGTLRGRGGLPSRARRWHFDASGPPGLGVAVAAHLLVRALTLLVLVATAPLADRSVLQVLTRWDARWYARIAEDGYGQVVTAADGRALSDYAFFPLFPAFERVVSALTGLSPLHAGLLVSAVASVVAAAGIYQVGRRLHDSRTGIVLVVLWSALPVSVVQSMAYTESLFTALAAWALYAVLVHRYVAAGALASLAGLTRPSGVAVVAAVMVAAALHLAGRSLDIPRQRGSLLGYLDVTHGWGNGFDGGVGFARWVWTMLLGGHPFAAVAVLLGLALLAAAVASTATRGYPVPVVVFTVVAVLLSFTTATYFGSKPRYLLPVFTLLLWPSPWLSRQPVARLLLVVGVLVAGSAAYGAFWLYGPGPP